MTHFYVAILVEPGENIEEEVKELLAPYDENIEVEPYKVHFNAEDIEMMAKHYATIDINILAGHMQDWHSGGGGVDEQGLYRLSTYNPISKWDWYVIGGRYEGRLLGKNVIPVEDIPEDFFCWALITPDGEWHEKGTMGWFAVSWDKDEHWPEKMRRLLPQYQGHMLVGVDCHI